jgi:hypothetical protein
VDCSRLMMIHRKRPDPIQTDMFMHTIVCSAGIEPVTAWAIG